MEILPRNRVESGECRDEGKKGDPRPGRRLSAASAFLRSPSLLSLFCVGHAKSSILRMSGVGVARYIASQHPPGCSRAVLGTPALHTETSSSTIMHRRNRS